MALVSFRLSEAPPWLGPDDVVVSRYAIPDPGAYSFVSETFVTENELDSPTTVTHHTSVVRCQRPVWTTPARLPPVITKFTGDAVVAATSYGAQVSYEIDDDQNDDGSTSSKFSVSQTTGVLTYTDLPSGRSSVRIRATARVDDADVPIAHSLRTFNVHAMDVQDDRTAIELVSDVVSSMYDGGTPVPIRTFVVPREELARVCDVWSYTYCVVAGSATFAVDGIDVFTHAMTENASRAEVIIGSETRRVVASGLGPDPSAFVALLDRRRSRMRVVCTSSDRGEDMDWIPVPNLPHAWTDHAFQPHDVDVSDIAPLTIVSSPNDVRVSNTLSSVTNVPVYPLPFPRLGVVGKPFRANLVHPGYTFALESSDLVDQSTNSGDAVSPGQFYMTVRAYELDGIGTYVRKRVHIDVVRVWIDPVEIGAPVTRRPFKASVFAYSTLFTSLIQTTLHDHSEGLSATLNGRTLEVDAVSAGDHFVELAVRLGEYIVLSVVDFTVTHPDISWYNDDVEMYTSPGVPVMHPLFARGYGNVSFTVGSETDQTATASIVTYAGGAWVVVVPNATGSSSFEIVATDENGTESSRSVVVTCTEGYVSDPDRDFVWLMNSTKSYAMFRALEATLPGDARVYYPICGASPLMNRVMFYAGRGSFVFKVSESLHVSHASPGVATVVQNGTAVATLAYPMTFTSTFAIARVGDLIYLEEEGGSYVKWSDPEPWDGSQPPSDASEYTPRFEYEPGEGVEFGERVTIMPPWDRRLVESTSYPGSRWSGITARSMWGNVDLADETYVGESSSTEIFTDPETERRVRAGALVTSTTRSFDRFRTLKSETSGEIDEFLPYIDGSVATNSDRVITYTGRGTFKFDATASTTIEHADGVASLFHNGTLQASLEYPSSSSTFAIAVTSTGMFFQEDGGDIVAVAVAGMNDSDSSNSSGIPMFRDPSRASDLGDRVSVSPVSGEDVMQINAVISGASGALSTRIYAVREQAQHVVDVHPVLDAVSNSAGNLTFEPSDASSVLGTVTVSRGLASSTKSFTWRARHTVPVWSQPVINTHFTGSELRIPLDAHSSGAVTYAVTHMEPPNTTVAHIQSDTQNTLVIESCVVGTLVTISAKSRSDERSETDLWVHVAEPITDGDDAA